MKSLIYFAFIIVHGVIECVQLLIRVQPCNSMGCSLLGSSVQGIFLARIQSELPFSPPGVLPGPGIKPGSLALADGFLTTEPPWKPNRKVHFDSSTCSCPVL